MTLNPKAPTVKAVVAAAAQLRARGEAQLRKDPYAKPYMPTDAAARKLSQRLGPVQALEALNRRAVLADKEHAEQQRVSVRADLAHERRRRQNSAALSTARANLTPGQRIDHAIAELAVISTVPASQLQADRIHGGERSTTPHGTGEPARAAHARALELARQLEDQVDRLRWRPAVTHQKHAA